MAQAFFEASAVTRVNPAIYELELPDGWQQGRGAFGGLVLGVLTRAMGQEMSHGLGHEGERAELRTLTGSLCGPSLPGPAQVRVEVLRDGSRLSFLRASLAQGEGFTDTKATATATFGASRPVESRRLQPEIEIPPWDQATPVDMRPPLGPVFTQHYEYRNTGPAPFSAGSEAAARGWVRNAVDPERIDAAALIGLLDTFWPAEFALDSAPRPMATISFTAELLVSPAQLKGDAPFYYRAHTQACADGFAAEFRELWRDGRLVAMNQQTFVRLG